jgi:hypothetical protein
MVIDRSSVRPWFVVIRQATVYLVPAVPLDSQTVTVPVPMVDESTVKPVDAVIVLVAMVSDVANQSVQSNW